MFKCIIFFLARQGEKGISSEHCFAEADRMGESRDRIKKMLRISTENLIKKEGGFW